MVIEENAIKEIVSEIVKKYTANLQSVSHSEHVLPGMDVNTAIEAARKAHEVFMDTSLETRRTMIAAIRRKAEENVEKIAKLTVEETGMGRYEDKIVKNLLAIRSTPGVEDVQPLTFTDDHGMTLTERAPFGVIGAIAPSTNPTATIINNAISMLSAGNTVVFNAHPAARKSSKFIVGLINEAILGAGGPHNAVVAVENPTIETAKTLMNHPDISLLVVTGGPGVVKQAIQSTKKVIAAGPGNPPCVVDETAEIGKAAKDIVAGAGFDNNIVCICEKEIIAVRTIADRLKAAMTEYGAFELDREETKRVAELVLARPGRKGDEGAVNKKYVGKDASLIAAGAGITVPESIKILLCEVDKSHPLVWTEQLMPVIPLVRVDDVDEAIDFAFECEHGFRHSASMHSMNIAKLSRMARIMNCSLFVKNGSNFNGMGLGGAGYTSFTIASPTGEGFTRARHFTRDRRCSLIDYFRIV